MPYLRRLRGLHVQNMPERDSHDVADASGYGPEHMHSESKRRFRWCRASGMARLVELNGGDHRTVIFQPFSVPMDAERPYRGLWE